MVARVVVALGGNAILQPRQRGTYEEQLENVRLTCTQIASMIQLGHEVVITHGNGPQVGNILIQNEEAAAIVPPMPLDVCGAQSQGLIGYMIQQCLKSELQSRGISKEVITIITQVLVDPFDVAFTNPTKPIGPFFTEERARRLVAEKGFTMKEDSGRGWRRVVPSPDPKQILERDVIRWVLSQGTVVIAAGGGGIPVVREGERIRGIEAVIDKDLAGERLAEDVGADTFMILTDVPNVFLDWGKPSQRPLREVDVVTARQYQRQGHFKAGSMGPKVEAACRFVENTGGVAVIAGLHQAIAAMDGQQGTRITRAGSVV
ncbi:MAG: carbamate kinase [Bacillota bacterium]